VIELRGTFRNLAKWFRLCERLVDRSPRMERNTDIGVMVRAESTSTAMLTRGQIARALREGAVGEARPGGTDGGAIATAISRVDVRKYINNKDLRVGFGCVTLAMLMAATIAVAPTAGIPRNSANPTSSAPKVAGSIPRTPSPSVGDGNSVHPYVSDVNQGHQKKMLNKITSVTAAAVVGIAATVAGAADLLVPAQYPTIQAAIDAANNGDGILVAAGMYVEQINLSGKYIRLIGTAGPENTTIDGNSAWTPIVGANEPIGCLVQGFTIQNGHAAGYWSGAAIEVTGSSLMVKDCIIRDNRATGYGWWASAGFRSQGGAPTLDGCVFINNEIAPIENISGASAVFHYAGGSIVIRNCEFTRNITTRLGGTESTHWARRVKIHSEFQTTSALIDGCVFNQQLVAGALATNQIEIEGVYSQLDLSITGCTFASPSVWTNVLVSCASATIHDSIACGFDSVATPWSGKVYVLDSALQQRCNDCDNTGTVDVIEIANGTSMDTNQNNIPDTCECIGDIDLDGAIGGSDLGIMLAYWGPVTTESVSLLSDLNADGFVNGSDLGALLAHWGACQG
jgi:hypothetical protein